MAINTDFFKEINTEEKAYWLGFIYADGHLCPPAFRRGAALTFNQKREDSAHLQKLASIFGRHVKNKSSKCGNKEYPSVRLDICSNEVYHDILSIGIPQKKTLNNDVTVFDNISKELKYHFIRGVFDGDGSIHLNQQRAYFSIAGTSKLLRDIRDYISQEVEVTKGNIKIRTNGFTVITWGGWTPVCRIRDWLYDSATIYLARKHKIFYQVRETTSEYGNRYLNRYNNNVKRQRNINRT